MSTSCVSGRASNTNSKSDDSLSLASALFDVDRVVVSVTLPGRLMLNSLEMPISVTSCTGGELPKLSIHGNVDVVRLFETTKRSSNVGVLRFSAMVKESNDDVAVVDRSVRKRECARWNARRSISSISVSLSFVPTLIPCHTTVVYLVHMTCESNRSIRTILIITNINVIETTESEKKNPFA